MSKSATQTKSARRRGRPPLPPGEAKRSSFNTRLRPDLKTQLEQAAADEGRSLSEEIEFRLERSFLTEDHLRFLAGDLRGATFVRQFLDVVALMSAFRKQPVWEDDEGYEALEAAVCELIRSNKLGPSKDYERRVQIYERYKEKRLRPWRKKGGGQGLSSNPKAGPMPTLKPSPREEARLLGRVAAQTIKKSRLEALAKALVGPVRERSEGDREEAT
jgi:hypothetical protein